MAWTVRNCALALATVSAAMMSVASVGEAQVRDCWLLDGGALEQARAQGSCQDSFARNGGTPAKPPAVRSKPKPAKAVAPKARAVEPAPQVAEATPSWNAPREEVLPPPVGEEIARSGTYAMREPPPPPPPPESFGDGLRRDLEHFVQDLDRDFSAFFRAIAGNPSRPRSGVEVSER